MRYLYYLYYVQLCPKNYAISLLNCYFVIHLGHSSFQTFLTPKTPHKPHQNTSVILNLNPRYLTSIRPYHTPSNHPVINPPVIINNPPFFILPVFWAIAFSLGCPFTRTPIYPPPIATFIGFFRNGTAEWLTYLFSAVALGTFWYIEGLALEVNDC